MAGKKVGIILAADGEKEFVRALSNANKEAQSFRAKLKELGEEYYGNANSAEYLSKKQALLANQMTSYKKKVEEAEKGLKHATQTQDAARESYGKLKSQVQETEKALEEMAKSGKDGTKEYTDQKKELDKLQKALRDQGTEYQKAQGKVSDWEKRLSAANTDVTKTNRAIKDNEKYLKEAEQATDKCAKSIDEYGKKAKEATEVTTSMGEKIKNALVNKATDVAVDALKNSIGELKETMLDVSDASASLEAQTGLVGAAAEKYRKTMRDIKGDNYGEDYRDVADVMAQIVQVMGELDEVNMKSTTESVVALREAFDMDPNETIRAVDVMIKTMGVDAKEAFDLIATGAQNGLNRSGELTDNITEYGQLWGQAGFSAEEAFSIMENGLNAGAYNLDKVNDYVKEFGISLADGRIQDNLASFSTQTQNLFLQWKNGGATTRDVFYSVINDLSQMTNQQQALTIASDVWSALGEDNAMQVITALDDVTDSYENVRGAAEKLKDVQYSDLGAAASGLGAALKENILMPITDEIEPIFATALSGATKLVKGFGDAMKEPETEMSGFVQSLRESNDDINKLIDSASQTTIDTQGAAAEMDDYKNTLLELNSASEKTAYEKFRIKEAVDALSGSVPGLANAFEEEKSVINLTNAEIEKMIDTQKNLSSLTDLTKAQETAFKAVQEAKVNEAAATDAVAAAEEHYQEVLKNGAVFGSAEYKEATKQVTEAKKAQSEAEETTKKAKTAYKETSEALKNYEGTAQETAEASQELAKATEVSTETARKAAQEIPASSQTQKEAMESLMDTYRATVDEIESDVKDSVNIFDKFSGGDDASLEDMLANLESQTDGLKEYKENMQTIMEEMGSDLAPEFLQYIQDMGIEGANILSNMVESLDSEDGREKIRQMSDEYVEAMDMSEGIAEMGALNKTAYEMAMGELGSSDDDFIGLSEAIEEAVAGASGAWGGLEAATRQALEDTVSLAQEMGVQIPEGLVDGINSGDITADEAISQLKGSIQGAFDGLVDIAQSNGIQIPESLRSGIEAGGQEAIDAMDSLLSYLSKNSGGISDAMAAGVDEGAGKVKDATKGAAEAGATGTGEAKDSYSSGGQRLMDATADGVSKSGAKIKGAVKSAVASGVQGVTENTEAYRAAGLALGNAVAAGISGSSGIDSAIQSLGATIAAKASSVLQSQAGIFQTAGNAAGMAYGTGLGMAAPNAMTQARMLAAQTLNGVKSNQGGYVTVGRNISMGVAAGIRSGRSSAISAAASMARAALTAAKRELDIHSPSRKFRKEVGQQIPTGMAFGIKDKSDLAGAEADKMSGQVFAKATAWLKKYKKEHKVSLKEEKWYWSQVAKHTKEGSKAYTDAISNMLKASVKRKEKGKKKNTEDYYGEIYSAAENYLSNITTMHEWSISEELNYWTSVQKQLKKGTDAYYDAQSKINTLKGKIGTVSNMDDILDAYTTYREISEKTEMDYWDTVRVQYEEGTEERLEADKKYYDAQKEYNEKLIKLKEDYKEKVDDINEQLQDDIEDLNDKYEDALEDRKKAIMDAFGLFDEFESESADGKTLLFNLKTQVAGYEDWQAQLDKLAGRGVLDENLMAELTEMGPEISATIHALNDLSNEELAEYSEAYLKKMELSQKQAEEDTKNLKDKLEKQTKDLNEEAEKNLAELKAKYDKDVASVNGTIAGELSNLAANARSIAEDQTAALVAAITGQSSGSSASQGSGSKTSGASGQAGTSGFTQSIGGIIVGGNEKVLEAINSGPRVKKLSGKEKKQHHDLYVYLADHYQRGGNNTVYQKLGEALGVGTSKKVTSEEKDKILKKLKNKGYRTGGRNITDDLIWMDEELNATGPEMIVRRSDNAILTRISPGDDVIDADTTSNLLRLAKIDPDNLMSALARQQQVAAEYLSKMDFSGSAARLNRLTETRAAYSPPAATWPEERLSRLEGLVEQAVSYLAERQNLYIDTGKLVGGTIDKTSSALAMRSRRRRR